MILDRTELREALFGLVGFYNPDNPTYPSLSPSLLTSRSGMYVNDVNSLITIENIDQSIKNFSKFNYPDYVGTTEYSLGDKVKDSGVNYEYINSTPSTGNAPPNTTYWRVIDEISDYLIKTIYAAIDEMTDQWINYKKIRSIIKSIYDDIYLFSGNANRRNLVRNSNNFVGLRFRLKRGEKSLVIALNKLGHQFSETFTGLPVYLYHASQELPIATLTIDHQKKNSFVWTTLTDKLLRYVSDDYDAGGDFFLGYRQSDLETLGSQALKFDIAWRERPCYGCGHDWGNFYQQYSPFLDVIGFSIAETTLGPSNEIFDTQNVSLDFTNNFGLNVNMTAKCDIGYFIIQEEDLFADALKNTAGLKLLESMARNIRGGNQVAKQVQMEAKKEIYHLDGVYGTVFDKQAKSIKALSFDLSGLSEECFPCDDGKPSVVLGKTTLY